MKTTALLLSVSVALGAAPALAARTKLSPEDRALRKQVVAGIKANKYTYSRYGEPIEAIARDFKIDRTHAQRIFQVASRRTSRLKNAKNWGITAGVAAVATVAIAAGVRNHAWGTIQSGGRSEVRGAQVELSIQQEGSWINPWGNDSRRLVIDGPNGRETVTLHSKAASGKISYGGVHLSADGNRLTYIYTRGGGDTHLFQRTRNTNGSWGPNNDLGAVRLTGVPPMFLSTSDSLDNYIAR